MISPSLKERVAVSIFSDIVKKNLEFKGVIKSRIVEMKRRSEVLSKKI